MTWFIFMGGMVLGVVVAYLSGMPTLRYSDQDGEPESGTRGELRALRARENLERDIADWRRLKRKYGIEV